MKRLTLIVAVLGLLLLTGCRSPQAVSGSLNKETKRQTTAVSNQVLIAQQNNSEAGRDEEDADQAVVDAMNDPGVTPETHAKLQKAHDLVVDAHKKREAVKSALQPITETILPKIDDAADKQLQATVDATNAGKQKERIVIDVIVGLAVAGALLSLGCGVAISLIGGAVGAGVCGVVLGLISDVLHEWGPYLIVLAVVGGIALYLEKRWKGSWKATLHGAFDESKQAVKALPADVSDLQVRFEALESAVKGFTPTPAAAESPSPTKS